MPSLAYIRIMPWKIREEWRGEEQSGEEWRGEEWSRRGIP
jgi:hypothetical protein